VYAVDDACFDTTMQLDQWMLVDAVEQERFEIRLVEHVGAGEAAVGHLRLPAELGHHPVAGVEQAQSAARS
jgi:hypothetical protein